MYLVGFSGLLLSTQAFPIMPCGINLLYVLWEPHLQPAGLAVSTTLDPFGSQMNSRHIVLLHVNLCQPPFIHVA